MIRCCYESELMMVRELVYGFVFVVYLWCMGVVIGVLIFIVFGEIWICVRGWEVVDIGRKVVVFGIIYFLVGVVVGLIYGFFNYDFKFVELIGLFWSWLVFGIIEFFIFFVFFVIYWWWWRSWFDVKGWERICWIGVVIIVVMNIVYYFFIFFLIFVEF